MSGGCLATWLGCQLSGGQFAHPAVAGRPRSVIRCRELVASKRSVAHALRPPKVPELRRRTQDDRGHPGTVGDREDPYASWAAGPGTAGSACPWVAAASGLTIPILHCSCGLPSLPVDIAALRLDAAAMLLLITQQVVVDLGMGSANRIVLAAVESAGAIVGL